MDGQLKCECEAHFNEHRVYLQGMSMNSFIFGSKIIKTSKALWTIVEVSRTDEPKI